MALSHGASDLCASDLGRLLGYDRPTVSKFLRALKETGLVEEIASRRRSIVRKSLVLGSGVEIAPLSTTSLSIDVVPLNGWGVHLDMPVSRSLEAALDRAAPCRLGASARALLARESSD